jgi:hypothetical protein
VRTPRLGMLVTWECSLSGPGCPIVPGGPPGVRQALRPAWARAAAPVCQAGCVTSSPAPVEGTPAAPTMPTSVRIAVIVMAVMAALLLTSAALLWYGYDALVDRLVGEGNISRADAGRFVTLSIIPNLILGVLLALSAWFLPRRQTWARWTGLATSGLLAVLTTLQLLSGSSLTIASLLLLVLAIAAVTTLASRSTRGFVPRLRARA